MNANEARAIMIEAQLAEDLAYVMNDIAQTAKLGSRGTNVRIRYLRTVEMLRQQGYVVKQSWIHSDNPLAPWYTVMWDAEPQTVLWKKGATW